MSEFKMRNAGFRLFLLLGVVDGNLPYGGINHEGCDNQLLNLDIAFVTLSIFFGDCVGYYAVEQVDRLGRDNSVI